MNDKKDKVAISFNEINEYFIYLPFERLVGISLFKFDDIITKLESEKIELSRKISELQIINSSLQNEMKRVTEQMNEDKDKVTVGLIESAPNDHLKYKVFQHSSNNDFLLGLANPVVGSFCLAALLEDRCHIRKLELGRGLPSSCERRN
jgi:hypothetical protein